MELAFDGSQINLLIAFLSGIITFFASCLLPLVPVYLAYLSGIATTSTKDNKRRRIFRREVFVNGVLFTIGFIFVFVLLGITVNTAGRVLSRYKPLIQKLGGAFFILIGLFMLNVVSPRLLLGEIRISLPKNLTKWKKINSFLMGVTFGFAWTPCIGPILAVILFWASQTQSFIQGVSLLIAYGVGIGIPFILVALLFDSFSSKLSFATKFGYHLQKVAAIIIIITGILLLLGKLETISIILLQKLNLNTLSA